MSYAVKSRLAAVSAWPETAGKSGRSVPLPAPIAADAERAAVLYADISKPTASDELWRQSRPELFGFERLLNAAPVDFVLQDFESEAKAEGVSGLSVNSFDEGLYHALLERMPLESLDAPLLLHTACLSSSLFIKVSRFSDPGRMLRLSQLVAADASSAAPLVVIGLEEGARLSLLEDLNWQSRGLFFPRVEFLLEGGSSLNFYSLQRLREGGAYYGRHNLHARRDSSGTVMHLGLGCAAARLDLDCNMYEPGCSFDLDAVYLSDGKRHVDFHPSQNHLAPHCRSELYYKGVIKDRARAVYYGYIRVAEKAQKTDAYQSNRNLLLSAEARADSIPNLRIQANDVRCSHGSSVGQLGTDELFYLMSRGLKREAAERLLVEGFLEDLLTEVKQEPVHRLLSAAILESLDDGVRSST